MSENLYGYVRVSSIDQNEARQIIEMARYGVSDDNIYMDKLSGKDFNRPQYQKLKRRLREGDVMVLKSIDRLGRNYEEIQREWREIVKVKKADIVVLDMPLLDTRTKKDLIGTLISDIVLQLLSYVAQSERESIRRRQAEGIAAAKARGVHFGKTALIPPENYAEIKTRYLKGEFASRKAGELLGVSGSTFLRWLRTMD